MPPPVKQANTDNTASPGRRSTRLAIAIPVAISGKNSGGAPFKENTRTVTINRQGAKVATMQTLTLGAEVLLENRHLGTSARGNVVWLGERKGPRDLVEIGVQLSEAENIWGIEFPPEDWQEGPPAQASASPSTPVEKPPPPAPIKAPLEVSAPKPPAAVADRLPVPAPAAARATLPATPAAATASWPPRSSGAATVPPQQIQKAVAAAVEQFNVQAEKALEGHAKSFEDRLARYEQDMGFQSQAQLQRAANALEEKLVASLEQKVRELGEQLAASRNEFETLLGRYRELQVSGARETEKAKQNIEAAGRLALQSAVEKASEEVTKEHRQIQQEFIAETRNRLAEEAATHLEELGGKNAAQLARLGQESIQRVESEIRALQAKTLEDKSGERLAAFEGQLEKTARKAQEKTARELSEHLDKLRDELLASAMKEFQKDLSEARAALKDELKSSWKTLAEEAKKQLGTMTHSTVEALNKEGKAGIEEFRGHLKKSAQENLEKATRELEAELRKAADRERQEPLTRIEEESSKAAANALKEASDTINKHIGSGAVFLKELEEQARTRLEALSEKMDSLVRASESELEKNAADFSTAAMQGMRASSDALAERFQEQVEKSTQEVASKFADDLHRKLGGATEKLVEESAAVLSEQCQKGLELAAAEFEKLKDRLVNETEEAIRSRLAEAFSSIFMPGGRRVTDRAADEAQKKP